MQKDNLDFPEPLTPEVQALVRSVRMEIEIGVGFLELSGERWPFFSVSRCSSDHAASGP